MNPEFETHLLTPEGVTNTKTIKLGFDALLDGIKELVPASRELSIVKTKLEEACFFAVKGVAVNPANQKVQ
jgi:hypothetical protein